MRYFTLYGAHGGHTNPAPLPFRVAKAKPCMQTAGIQTLPEARKVTRHWRARGKEGKKKYGSRTSDAKGAETIGSDFR